MVDFISTDSSLCCVMLWRLTRDTIVFSSRTARERIAWRMVGSSLLSMWGLLRCRSRRKFSSQHSNSWTRNFIVTNSCGIFVSFPSPKKILPVFTCDTWLYVWSTYLLNFGGCRGRMDDCVYWHHAFFMGNYFFNGQIIKIAGSAKECQPDVAANHSHSVLVTHIHTSVNIYCNGLGSY